MTARHGLQLFKPMQWRHNWEALFLLAIEGLLIFQVVFFQAHVDELDHVNRLMAT